MVYSVMSVVTRRSLTSISSKHILTPYRLVPNLKPLVCTYADERPSGTEVSRIISKTITGKLTVKDVTGLYTSVAKESQYQRFTEAPKPALYLGLGGLVPFAAVPILTVLNGVSLDGLVFAQLAYGATILSFMGGINWGVAVAKETISFEKLGWAVVPQLIGWTALSLPLPVGILVTSFGLSASLVHDVLLTSYPQWFKALRFVLTSGAIVSLITTLFLSAAL